MSTVEQEPVTFDESGGYVPSTDGALMALNASEIDTQIATAKKYPRSVKQFRNEALEMATLTEAVASECMYSLPRGGKPIEGPSARFAEIIASAWGNCRAGARIIGEDDRFVTVQGAFLDLQRNVAITYETKRRITDKSGRKFKDDMVGVTANAACSIALRNAILKGIPKAFWKDIYEESRRAAIGDVKTLAGRRADMLAYFAKMGVQPEQIFELLEVGGEADITLDHLATLKGMATALKDGDTTIEMMFGGEPTGGNVNRSKLNDELDKTAEKSAAKGKAKPAKPEPDSDEPTAEEAAALERQAAREGGTDGALFDTSPNYD